VAGEAWQVALQPLGQRGRPDYDATVGFWIVKAPQSHPLWWWYSLSIIHLRPVNGVREAYVSTPDSTHELLLLALSPECPVPDLYAIERNDYSSLRHLVPANLAEQFQVANDAEAHRLGELAVSAIVNGLISPDTDYRSHWKHAIAETARHFREGVHTVKLQ
jgi:hypothetical protein